MNTSLNVRIGITLLLLCIPTTGQVRRRPTTISNQDEGQREALKFWSNYIAACGGSHYVKQTYAVFFELRGFRINMRYDPITEADRLNGIQAKGVSSYTATAHRVYEKGAWHEWGDSIPQGLNLVNAVRFQKARGRWNFQPVGYFDQFAQRVNCSEVPGHRSASFYETPTNAIDINDNLRMPIQQFFFWDSNTNIIGDKFPQSLTGFVSWKIIYGGTAFDYSLSPVVSRWYRDNVQVFETTSARLYNGNPAALWTGVGWQEPGKWEIGAYLVRIFVRGRLVKTAQFQIAPDAEFSPELRFDGLYRSPLGNTDKYDWLRFYPDGTVLLGVGLPTTADLGVCVSMQRTKFAAGCEQYSYRTGTYRITNNNISFSFSERDGSRGAPVDVTGRVGAYVLTLNYDVGRGAAIYRDHQETFLRLDRMY
jgi:hypothetical protein